MRRLGAWALSLGTFEGSTRPVGLLRIGVVLLAWAEWARILMPVMRLEPIATAIGLSFYVSSLVAFVGHRSQLAMGWLGLSMTAVYQYHGRFLGQENFTHHHSYFLVAVALVLALTPCGGSYSLDRVRAVRKARRDGQATPPERGNLWAMRLIGLQLCAIYLWGAYHKLTTEAFVHGERMEHYTMTLYLGSDYPRFAGFHALMVALSVATIGLELSLVVGLWVRRFQRWLIPAGIAFHLLLYYALPVATFSLTSILAYLAFLDPDAVHRFLDDAGGPNLAPRPDAH